MLALRRKVQAWFAEQEDGVHVIALRARPEWTAEPTLCIDGETVRVVPCPTPIAARAALHDRRSDERLVLLTELADAELGDGILAHLSRQTVRGVEPWDLVRQLFGGRANLDPALVRGGRWLADALSDFAPPAGWPAPAGAVVSREHALRCLAGEVLGLPAELLDSAGLLQWSTDAQAQLRFVHLPTEVAGGIISFLKDTAGPVAVPVLAAARAGHGVDAIPLGLLASVLWPRDGVERDVDIAVARTRLEPRFGGVPLSRSQAEVFANAAEAWVDRAVDSDETRPEAVRMLARAEVIAAEIGIADRLAASALLPSGFTARMRTFADAVLLAVPAGGQATAEAVARVQVALADLEDHRDLHQRSRVESARMAVRLLRWLTAPDGPRPSTLYEALLRQVRDDSWVDRARLDLFAGDVDVSVAEAYQRLYRAVDVRRATHDRQFAELLAETTAAEAEPGDLLRVEDVLDRVVQPILDHGQRVLLLLLDGMSTAGATELAESIVRTGALAELTPAGGARTGILAALPTVTEVSRCSLLSGRISVGGQQAERTAFAARFPHGVLLHKAGLRTGAGTAVDPDISVALDDPKNPVVAAVINTIDDALDRSDPGTTVWGTDTIGAVRDLLAVNRDRVVVLLSDHGHVVDRGSDAVTRSSESSENRWRPSTVPAGDGEVLVSGRRVALGGGRVVLPWREEIRYGPRKAGYHGGASPAEAVIPLLIFSLDEAAVPGWVSAPVPSPEWWREPLPESPSSQPAARPNRRPEQPKLAAPENLALFEVGDEVPASAGPAVPTLVEQLLASEIYRQRRGTRAPLTDERVAALVSALLAGNGRATFEALAVRAGVPAHRITGTVTALRKLLQVEGYPVITIDPDGITVLLDEALMVEQFGLGNT